MFEVGSNVEKKIETFMDDIQKEDETLETFQKIESLADGQYKVGIVTSLNSSKSSSSQSKESNDTDFDITKPDLAHSTGFQLPNLFSLLNSLLH